MLRLLAAALLASAALAQNYYSAGLDGAQEVPPTPGTARGWGIVRHDTATNVVAIFVYHEGLTGAPVAAHMHSGATGVNGPIVVPLIPTTPNTYTGSGVLTAPQASALGASGMYLNVHTPINPGGEIRGQVVPAASTRFTGLLSGAQQVPPVASPGTGTAVAWLHEPENRISYMVESTGLANVFAAHFHQGAAGVNGPIIIDFGAGTGTYCGVSNKLTAAQVATWKANGFYANIHTTANPGGEIRAQMIRDVGHHFVAALSGTSEVPPTPSAGVGGVAVVVNPNGTLSLTGEFSGLTGPPSAAHVHNAPAGVNGPIVFPLTIAGSQLTATFTPTAADLINLRNGNWYVNVHTVAFPGGEVRGQLLPAILPTTFGQGCLGSNGVRPQIGATAFPSLGSSMSIDLYGALPGGPVLFVFGNLREIGGTPLTLELPVIGINSPGCFLLVTPDALFGGNADPFGCAKFPLVVPLLPALRGLEFFTQWFTLDVLANPGFFVASSALTIRIQ